jgi:hypothetical protein
MSEMNQRFGFDYARSLTRRTFLGQTGLSLGALALGTQLQRAGPAAPAATPSSMDNPLAPKPPPYPAKARAVIYLHMSGGPPTLDLFDWKPKLVQMNFKPCPDELTKGMRFAFIKGTPMMLGTPYKFKQYGKSGTWVSDRFPHFTKIVDDVCVIRSVNTDQFNHAPAELFIYTGSPRAGNASLGSWVTYGLGTENQDLPGFVVLLSGGTDPTGGKSLWSSGFLPSVYQGVQCRTSGEPILFSNNPPGMERGLRRQSLDALKRLNELEAREYGDPETLTRISQYELAYRMQIAVPEVFDIKKEPKQIQTMYGAEPGQGSFPNNCLLARRLIEKGVRYVQLYDWGWDIHGTAAGDDLLSAFPKKCKEVDQACAALILDLKQRSLLESTLVIWGGEFGRTPMNEARGGSKFLGRDHHPNCFTIWMAGGGIRSGFVFGETDDFGYNVASNQVTIRDLQATILHLLGFDPYQFSFRYQGLGQRLIGPSNEGKIVRGILA